MLHICWWQILTSLLLLLIGLCATHRELVSLYGSSQTRYHSASQINYLKCVYCITFVGGNSWSSPPNTAIQITKLKTTLQSWKTTVSTHLPHRKDGPELRGAKCQAKLVVTFREQKVRHYNSVWHFNVTAACNIPLTIRFPPRKKLYMGID